MQRHWIWGFIAPGLVLSLSTLGCWVPKETGQVMQRDLRLLRADLQETQKGFDAQQARLEEQLGRADEQTKSIEDKMKQLDRAARKTDAGFGVQLEELRREIQEQRGTIELLTYNTQQLEKKLEEQAAKLEGYDTVLPGGASPPSNPQPPVAGKVPKDKKLKLAFAKQLISKGKKVEARGVLRDLVKKFPKDAGITDDAYFQLGELYYREKNYRAASLEYVKVLDRFPKGKFVADGYYRIGLCSMELGNLEDARLFFDEVIKKHRRSPLVKYAKVKSREVARRLEKEKKRRGK